MLTWYGLVCGGHAPGETPLDPLHNSYLSPFLHLNNNFLSKIEPAVLHQTRP